MDVTHVVDLVGKLGPLFVGIAVALIAWRQWAVQDNKLKLELFDRRFAIFDGFTEVRASIEFQGTILPSHRMILARATKMVPFFFQNKQLHRLTHELFDIGWSASVLCNSGQLQSEDSNRRVAKFDEAQAAMLKFAKVHDRWDIIAKREMRVGR